MAHEILSVKLCQLDDRIGKLHSRIHLSETAGHNQLRREIEVMEHECIESESALRENLRRSKSSIVSALAQDYERIEQVMFSPRKESVSLMLRGKMRQIQLRRAADGPGCRQAGD